MSMMYGEINKIRKMKMKFYIFTLFAFMFWGCQDFNTDEIPSSTKAELIVNLDIPEPTIVKSRTGGISNQLSSLCVLVFDKSGLYLSKHDGVFTSGTTTTANYRFGSIPTTKGGELLILHFVANYDWSSFSDAANVGKSEAEVMNNLTVSNGNVAYWQRVELPNGLDGARGTVITLKDNISLLRNIAKITVENLTNEPVEKKYLTDVTFAVGDYIDRGTVAPYSTSSYKFIKGAITEAINGNIVSITGENDFLKAQDGSAGTPSDVKYVYERKNSTARNQTYIIIKACFQSTLTRTDNTTPSYYKIDLDNDEATELLDIERNYHYIIRINDVAVEGYPTLKEAMENPASNNINAAVQVAEYTSVSDGTNILQIEKAVYSFVNSGQDFQIQYSYFDGMTSKIDNAKVFVTLDQNASMQVIKNGAFSYSNGVISATTADVPTNNDIYQATFTVSDGKYLARKITIRLRKPMNFLNVSVTPNNGTDATYCKVGNSVGQPVTITFSFPPDISPAVFPMPVYIYTKKLSPDPTKEGIQPLSIDPRPNNTFRYVYMAPYLGNDANDVPIPHTAYMVSATPSTNEDVILASDYFNDVPILVRSENMPALSNIKFNPNPVLSNMNEPVVLTFDIPEVADKTLPYKIRIHTDYLEYVSTTGLDCVWDNVMGVYYYTTNKTGSQSITFKTNKIESSEYVRIDGDRFASTTVKRSVKLGEFKNTFVNIASGTIGTPVDIKFSFDAQGASYITNGRDIYFTTQYLEPAPGSGIVSTGKTYEYKMLVSSSAEQTAKFVLKKALNAFEGENVKIEADGFKGIIAPYIIGHYTFGSDIPEYKDRPVFVLNGAPITLADLPKYRTIFLHFSIPASTKVNNAPVSETNPLWLYYDCSINTQYLAERSNTNNIAEFWQSNTSVAVRLQSYRRLWFKITSTGDKKVELSNDVDYDPSIITLSSVSGPGETVSTRLFETYSNIQIK